MKIKFENLIRRISFSRRLLNIKTARIISDSTGKIHENIV